MSITTKDRSSVKERKDVVTTKFDYAGLGSAGEIALVGASKIKTLCKQAACRIIAIGKVLLEVKAKIPHGQFHKWAYAEFGWGEDTVRNYMRVADRFSDNPKLSGYGISVLYLLAGPKVPESTFDELDRMKERGEKITYQRVKKLVAKYHDKPPRTEPVAKKPEFIDEQLEADRAEVEAIQRGEHQAKYAAASEVSTSPTSKPTATKTDADILIEKVERLVSEIDRMASERMGHNVKSRAVVNHFNDAIPLIKAMGNSWRNQ